MSSRSAFVPHTPADSGGTVLLASPDSQLSLDLQRIFHAMGLHVETATDSEAAITAIQRIEDTAVIVLDVLLAGVATGRLMAELQESGVHRRCPIALIAESISDEWIARLREGVIDDIVPRSADTAAWATHLSTMRRGHKLLCELEQLRDASLHEAQHDRVTGTFNRGTMLTMLFRETDRVQRLRGSLSLMLFAIDDLAYWTGKLCQDACDRMLREVAKRTSRSLRSYDLLGRTGHDEFLLALPGCSPINAAIMADRMRMDVFGEPFVIQEGLKEAVTVRLTACFAVTSSRGRSPVVVMREAAQTLALSRQSGPGSIRCAGESPLPADFSVDLASLFPDTELIV